MYASSLSDSSTTPTNPTEQKWLATSMVNLNPKMMRMKIGKPLILASNHGPTPPVSSLLQIFSCDNCTSKDLWDKLDEFFLNNKMSRMLQLQEQFRITKKGASSITKFCHSLKNLADALEEYDSKIDEVELVMQILRQFPPSYHSIVDVITKTKPFPFFLKAKNMLLIYELREETTKASSETLLTSITALYSSSSQGKPKNQFNKNKTNGWGAFKGGVPQL